MPRRQRVAAYAVIVRGRRRPAVPARASIAEGELWTLPGGGIDFGEHPDDAVVREVYEETGLALRRSGAPLWIGSARRVVDREPTATDGPALRADRVRRLGRRRRTRAAGRRGRRVHRRRPLDPAGRRRGRHRRRPCRWCARRWPTTGRQRGSGWRRTRWSRARRRRAAHPATRPRGPRPGQWTLPGGGVDHGESPAVAVAREVREETGLTATVGPLLGVHDEHFTGTAPHGREEDFHGVAPRLRGRRSSPGEPARRRSPTAPPTTSRGCRWPTSRPGAVAVSPPSSPPRWRCCRLVRLGP